jgi:hypothetical protein
MYPTSTLPIELTLCQGPSESGDWGTDFSLSVDRALVESLLAFYDASRAAGTTNSSTLQQFAAARFGVIISGSDAELFTRGLFTPLDQQTAMPAGSRTFGRLSCPPGTTAASSNDTLAEEVSSTYVWRLSDQGAVDGGVAPNTSVLTCALPCPAGCSSCTNFLDDGSYPILGSVCTVCAPGWVTAEGSATTYDSPTAFLPDGLTPYPELVRQCVCNGCVDPATGYCVSAISGSCVPGASPLVIPSMRRRRALEKITVTDGE